MSFTRSIGFLVAAAAVTSSALSQTYALRSNQIRVGTLLLASQNNFNDAPYAFFYLDRDVAVKPAAWTLVNPNSPRSWSSADATRYGAGAAVVGNRIAKQNAPYWETTLSRASDAALANYDVLLVPISGRFRISPLERERMRRFVDQGGTLWFDLTNPAWQMDDDAAAPIPFRNPGVGAGNFDFDYSNPILSRPNQMSADELGLALGSTPTTFRAFLAGDLAVSRLTNTVPADSQRLRPVAFRGTNVAAAVGQIGDGYVVITTGVSKLLSGGGTGAFASGVGAGSRFWAAAKLAVNIVGFNTTYASRGGSSRKTNSVAVDLAAPLIRRLKSDQVVPAVGTSPVMSNGRIFIATGSALVCLDASPTGDLDGDGNTDDGVLDPLGSEIDVVWSVTGNFNQTPVVVPAAGGANGDEILASDDNGNVRFYPVEPADPNNPSVIATIAPPNGSTGPVYGPTVHDGVGFMLGELDVNGFPLGRIWAFDVRTRQLISTLNPFVLERAPRLGRPAGVATVGYIPVLDNSGAVDRVIYVPTLRDTNRATPAGLSSVWFGTKGESPSTINVVVGDPNNPVGGITASIQTRAALQGVPVVDQPGSVYGIKLSFIYSTGPNAGLPLSQADLNALVTSQPTQSSTAFGFINVDINNGANGLYLVAAPNAGVDQPTVGVRVDYTLDWGRSTSLGGSPSKDQYVRGDLQLPDLPQPEREILGPIALTEAGTLMLVHGSRDFDYTSLSGGGIYCIREEGRGDFKTLYRWEIYEGAPFTPNGPAQFNYGPSLIDFDGVTRLGPPVGTILDSPLQRAFPVGGATVRGDTAYVAVRVRKQQFQNSFNTVVIALNANPPTPEVQVAGTVSNFNVIQTDPARTLRPGSTGAANTVLVPGNFAFEPAPSATELGRLRFTNVSQVSRGRAGNVLIANLPFIVRQNGSDVVIEPELGATTRLGNFVPGNAGGRWSPLRWYSWFNGTRATTQPIINGDHLYIGGDSILPALLTNQINFGNIEASARGFLYGVMIKVSPNDLITPTEVKSWQGIQEARPWVRYLTQINIKSMGPDPEFQVPPYFVWPQFSGISTLNDLAVRVAQSAVDETGTQGLAAGDGTLAVWTRGTESNLYSFTRGDFIVADEGRISRLDSAGNPIWSTEFTAATNDKDGSAEARQVADLATPRRAYALGRSGFILADPARDSVTRIDNAGTEIRSIRSFQVHPRFIPDGFRASESTNLKSPGDVTTFTSVVAAGNNPFGDATGPEWWRHYIIADTGNFRVIEVVDRYTYVNNRIGDLVQYNNAEGVRVQAQSVLLWRTKSQVAARKYAYNSVYRYNHEDGTRRHFAYAFGFGNLEPGRASNLDGGGGPERTAGNSGILLYDPEEAVESLITEVDIPQIGANVLFDPVAGNFGAASIGARTKRIEGLSSVTVRYVNNQLAIMFADNSGVYEVVENGGRWQVVWMLTGDAYKVLRWLPSGSGPRVSGQNPMGFRPVYARRLDNGDVIITTSWSGATRGSAAPLDGARAYRGEVMIVDGRFDFTNNPASGTPGFSFVKPNFGFSTLSIRLSLPPMNGIRPIVAPTFADER